MFIKESKNSKLFYAMDDDNKIIKVFTSRKECMKYLDEHHRQKRLSNDNSSNS